MIPGFEAIVEERLKKAQKKGAFDNLPGANKPLEFRDSNVPEELKMGHKILKNAGFLPPEVELRKQIQKTEDLWNAMETDDPARPTLRKKLNYLLTKLDATRNSGFSLMADRYRQALEKKLS